MYPLPVCSSVSRSCLLSAILLAACVVPTSEPPVVVICPAGESPDGDAGLCVPDGCGAGPWGDLQVDGDTVYVNGDAADGGDGAEASPLSSVQAGADLAMERGGATVAVAEGTYLETVSMGDGYRGVVIEGRCKELVIIDGSEGGSARQGVPTISIIGDQKRPEVSIAGVTVTRGTNTGVWVQGATVALTNLDVADNPSGGIVAVGATLDLDGVRISGSTPDDGGDFGYGLDVEGGATVSARACSIEANTDAGVFVAGSGASVELDDTTIVNTLPGPDGTGGYGIEVQDGAALTATGCTLRRNGQVGIFLNDEGTTVVLADTAVLETAPTAQGESGHGIEVLDGASLVATRCTVEGSSGVGIYVVGAGARADLDTVVVQDTASGLDGAGWGIAVGEGATLTANGCAVVGSYEVGVNAVGEGTVVDLLDTAVSETARTPEGLGGQGVNAQGGAVLTASGCTVDANAGPGAVASDTADLTLTSCSVLGNGSAGVFAFNDGTIVTLDGTRVEGTTGDPSGEVGAGLCAQHGARVSVTGCTFQGNAGSGVAALDPGTDVQVMDSAILDTIALPSGSQGYGLAAQDGATLRVSGCTIQNSVCVGVFAGSMDTTVTLADSAILDTQPGRHTSVALGLASEAGAMVTAARVTVSGTIGPGVYVASGALECTNCTLVDNQFAGALVSDGSLTLSVSTITDTLPDPELGGGFGLYASSFVGPPEVLLMDSTVGPHPYAAVWLDGPGLYDVQRNDLRGSPGVEQGGSALQGNAVFAENGVTAWDDSGATGLRILDNIISDAGIIAVFLDKSSATLSGNVWSGNVKDVQQQRCADVMALGDEDLIGVPQAHVCPAENSLTAYDITFSTLYLPSVSTEP